MPFYSYPHPMNADDILDKHVKKHRKNLNNAIYTAMIVSLLIYGMLAFVELFMEDEVCERKYARPQQNVDYQLTPCHFDRQMW